MWCFQWFSVNLTLFSSNLGLQVVFHFDQHQLFRCPRVDPLAPREDGASPSISEVGQLDIDIFKYVNGMVKGSLGWETSALEYSRAEYSSYVLAEYSRVESSSEEQSTVEYSSQSVLIV